MKWVILVCKLLAAAIAMERQLMAELKRAATVVIVGHVVLWVLSFSEVAAAFWGTNKALPLAAAEAGAHGGAPWQELTVTLCHAVPAILLMVAWALLVWGVWRVFKGEGRLPDGEIR